MRFIALRLFAAISGACFAAQCLAPAPANATAQPRYGGTLRVELHTSIVSLNPRAWSMGSLETATDEKLAGLIFERLVELDNYGRFQPVLATEWSHDNTYRRWQLVLRSGVKFSDGAPLTGNDVVAALQPVLPETLQISASGNTVAIQSTAPVADLLEQLASGRFFIYRTAADGTLRGTGPFILTANSTAAPPSASVTHLVFRADEDAWSGRPYLDAVDVTLSVPPLRAMFDLQLGKADLIELAPELVPRAKQANLRVWSSDPVVLYGLRFDDAQVSGADARLREALSLALDRGTMANVLLQKQAQPAAALLPQWLSGYAFLFNVEANLERAKELRRSQSANAAAAGDPLRLRVDLAGDLPQLLGQRVAVNARQAGIVIQVVSRSAQHSGIAVPASTASASGAASESSGVHLFAWRYSSLSARVEFDSMLAAYNLSDSSEATGGSDREQLYARERRILESWRVLPLVEQAESVGIGTTVRNWMPARWGEWHLADVWIEQPETTQAAGVQP
jgi:ABC-type transport system substrate-binding protein